MRILTIVLLFAFCSFVFADNSGDLGAGGKDNITDTVNVIEPPSTNCNLSYYDVINVRALDAYLRPVQNAFASVRYQVDKSTGKGFFTTPKKPTGESGNVSFFIRNQEAIPSNLDCNVYVFLTFQGANYSKKVIAQSHPSFIDFNLDAYILRVLVVDEHNSAINGATVFVNDLNQTTSNGMTEFKVLKGNTRIFVKYLEGKAEDTIDVKNDSTFTVQLVFYKLKINVLDDRGNPLDARVTIDDSDYQASNGELSFGKFVGQYHTAVVEYGGKQKTLDLDLAENSEYDAYFDSGAPRIENVNVVEENGKLKVVVIADDPGKYPSGLPSSAASLRYVTPDGGSKKISFYQSKPSEFVAEIPVASGMSEISFTIEIRDKENNKAIAEGLHKLSPNSQNASSSDSGQAGNNTPSDGIPLHYIVGGIIILLVVFYAVYRLKFKKE